MKRESRISINISQFKTAVTIAVLIFLSGCAPNLHQAIAQRNKALAVEIIEKSENVDIPDKKESTPLHYASHFGDDELVRMLIKKGADINRPNIVKNTPLILAARKGHLETVKILLENGAGINFQNSFGETALHNSAVKGHYEVTRFLIENHADVNLLAEYLESPIHYSMLEGDHPQIALLLLGNGAKLSFEESFLTDERWVYSARSVFSTARIYRLAADQYYKKGQPEEALGYYQKAVPAFDRASKKFVALSKYQKKKEERAKLINILSGIGYIGAAGTGTSSTWAFKDTDKYKTQSEASTALSALCEQYSKQCASIAKCIEQHGPGDALDSCVSKYQPEISETKKNE